MKRRDFLKKAGMVGIGVVAAPAIVKALPKPKPYPVDHRLPPNLELVNNELTRGDLRLAAEGMLEDSQSPFEEAFDKYHDFARNAGKRAAMNIEKVTWDGFKHNSGAFFDASKVII